MTTSSHIPADVAKWADEIRIVGNDAAHDAAELAKEDVDEIAEFVDAFLQYVFTMPAKFARRQSRKNAANVAP
ncbi:MAG: DUF4145 domain-containing protein [Filomicrobium sp.]|nr:DUF4145 domain-containing protein [Filomicrobium sp.]